MKSLKLAASLFLFVSCNDNNSKNNVAENNCSENCQKNMPSNSNEASLNTSAASPVVFDLINELKIENTAKDLMLTPKVAKIAPGETNSACIIKYTNSLQDGKITASPVKSSDEFKTKWFASGWKLAEWNNIYSFCDASAEITKKGNAVTLARIDSKDINNKAKILQIRNTGITLYLRSLSHYKGIFNGTFYRNNSEKRVPALHLGGKFKRVKLTDYVHLNLSLQTKLNGANIITNKLPGTPPAGAQNSYDPKIHATQYRFYLPVQWFEDACVVTNANANPPITKVMPTPDYCKNHGKYFHFGVSIYDERQEFSSNTMSVDPGTQSFMFQQDLRALLPNGQNITKNPFKTAGTILNIATDIKPIIIQAIKKVEIRNKEMNDKNASEGKPLVYYIPERIKINGKTENDEQYFSHFGISSTNIGYEVPGLSQIGAELYEYKMTGQN